MTLALTLLAAIIFTLGCWVLFVAILSIRDRLPRLPLPAKLIGYVVYYGFGLPANLLLNGVIGSIVFLDPPREVGFTRRLRRYLDDSHARPWRRKRARWLCDNLLNPFDTLSRHC